MRTDNLRSVIATDIPHDTVPPETARLEVDEDLTRRDAWMFGPLLAATLTLPIVASAMLGLSAWHLISNEASLSAPPPNTFASRWPDRELPLVVTAPL